MSAKLFFLSDPADIDCMILYNDSGKLCTKDGITAKSVPNQLNAELFLPLRTVKIIYLIKDRSQSDCECMKLRQY